MPSPPIPATVQDFIREYIDSAEKLEILLQLYFQRGREWSPEAMANAVFTTATSARARLDSLVEAGLVAQVAAGVPRYVYSTEQQALDLRVQELTAAYRENRGGVLEAVFARNQNTLQSFSDAFKLGKKDP